MFLVNDILVWRDRTVPRALELYGARNARAFSFRNFFDNLKSSFSEDNMQVHALDVFHPIKHKK